MSPAVLYCVLVGLVVCSVWAAPASPSALISASKSSVPTASATAFRASPSASPTAMKNGFTHSPTRSAQPSGGSPSPSHSPRPTPSVSHTMRPSIAPLFNHTGRVTMLIDDFKEGTWQTVAAVGHHSPWLVSNYEQPPPCGESLLGCSRSIILQCNNTDTVSMGTVLPAVFFRVPGSIWFAPFGDGTTLTLQYDGDDDPNSLNIHGLGGMDFTVHNRSQAVLFSVIAGYGAVQTIRFEMYDIYGGVCVGEKTEDTMNCHNFVPQALLLHQFSGGCDMKAIGAFQLTLISNGNANGGSLALGRISLVDFVDIDKLSQGSRC